MENERKTDKTKLLKRHSLKFSTMSEKRIASLIENNIRSAGGTVERTAAVISVEVETDWIDNIEKTLGSIENIFRSPKTFITDYHEVVNVEKVRKIDHNTIIHLAGHTADIKNVDESGRIEPARLLGKFTATENVIYENRFVYTLLTRLREFVVRRLDAISQITPQKKDIFCYNTEFDFGGIHYGYDTKITGTKNVDDEESSNLNSLERLKKILKRISSLENSPFAATLKDSKPVLPPIQKTNILTGNVDYNNCYNLWVFITSFDKTGYMVKTDSKILDAQEIYDKMVSSASLQTASFIKNGVLVSGDISGEKVKTKYAKYRVERSSDIQADAPKGLIDEDFDLTQYYFDKLKALTSSVSSVSNATSQSTPISLKFRKYFKGISILNNKMFLNILKVDDNREDGGIKPGYKMIEYARKDLELQNKTLKKYEMLLKLKQEELEAFRKRVETQQKRVENRKSELTLRIQAKRDLLNKKKENAQKKRDEAEKMLLIKRQAKLLKKLEKSKELAEKASLTAEAASKETKK